MKSTCVPVEPLEQGVDLTAVRCRVLEDRHDDAGLVLGRDRCVLAGRNGRDNVPALIRGAWYKSHSAKNGGRRCVTAIPEQSNLQLLDGVPASVARRRGD